MIIPTVDMAECFSNTTKCAFFLQILINPFRQYVPLSLLSITDTLASLTVLGVHDINTADDLEMHISQTKKESNESSHICCS